MKNINKIVVLICLSAGLVGCNQQADKSARDTSSIKTTKVQKNHKPQAKKKNVAKTVQQKSQTEAQPKVSDATTDQVNNQNRQQNQNAVANQYQTKSEQSQATSNNSVAKQAPTKPVVNNATQAANLLSNYLSNQYGNGTSYVPIGSQIYNGQKAYIINLYLPNDIHPAAAYFVLSNGTIIRKW